MDRRTFLGGCALAGLVPLTGCTGDSPADGTDGPGTPTATPDGGGADTPTPSTSRPTAGAGNGTPTHGGGGATPTPGTWRVFDFSQPGRWEFDAFVRDTGDGTVTLDVTDVSASELTVSVTTDLGGQQFSTTATGPPESVRAQVLGTPAGFLLSTTMFTPAAWYAGKELTVGTQWSVTTSEGSASFAVTGTDAVAGVDCYTTRMVVDGTTVFESCISPEHGLAPYTAWYGEDGELEMEMRLERYTPG